MGGHAAWRKRVERGELAKGSGGAALRHRPRFGRRGADLALNRKGNLGGHGNPKKKKIRRKASVHNHDFQYHQPIPMPSKSQARMSSCLAVIILLLCTVVAIYVMYVFSHYQLY